MPQQMGLSQDESTFVLNHTINAAGDKNIQLSTQNKFVDKDIVVKITTPAITTLSLNLTDNTETNVTVGDLDTTNNNYPLTANLNGNIKSTTAGWLVANTNYSVSDTGIQVGTIPKASFTVSDNKFYCSSPGYITAGSTQSPHGIIDPVTPAASIDTGTSSNYNGLTTYFTKQSSSSGASVTIKPRYSTSAGYVSDATNVITSDNITYWKIKTVTPVADTADVVLYKTDGSNAGTNISSIIIEDNISTTEPNTSGSYYLAFTGSGNSKATSAGWVSKTSFTGASATKYFPVTAAELTVSKTGGSIVPTASLSQNNISWSNTDTSGISVTATGNGSVSNLSIKANVSTPGYIPNGDIATADSISIAAASTAATDTKYITGVTVGSDKSFSVTNSGGSTTVTSNSTSAGTVTITAKTSTTTTNNTTESVVINGIWRNNTLGTGTIYTTTYGRTNVYYGEASASFADSNIDTYFNSGSSSSHSISITPQYTISKAGWLEKVTNQAGTTSYYTIKTTSVVNTNNTTVSGTTATRATATWETGWITKGSIAAATFANKATKGVSYVDISDTTAAPVLISQDYLYINRGYVDNIKISLAKLVPDYAVRPVGASSYAEGLLSGYALYDEAGNLVTGSINTITLPTSLNTSSSSTYPVKANVNVSTSARWIRIPKGYNSSNASYYIRPVSMTNLSPANIKYGITIKVGDDNDDDRLSSTNGIGTFTKADTVSSGQTALSYNSTTYISGQMLSGYSAWVDGQEIKGGIITKDSTELSFDGATRTFTAPAGYYANAATKQIALCTITKGNGAVDLTSDTGTLSIYSSTNAHGIGISNSAPASNSGKVYIKITANGKVTTGVGWNNTSTETTSNDKVRYISLNKYDGTYSIT